MEKQITKIQCDSEMRSLFNSYGLPPFHLIAEYNLLYGGRNMRYWKKKLLKLYQKTCLLSGIVDYEFQSRFTVGHHLYSQSTLPELQKSFFNGVLIEESLQKQYHLTFGKTSISVTPESFIEFIESLKSQTGFLVEIESDKLWVSKKNTQNQEPDFVLVNQEQILEGIPLSDNFKKLIQEKNKEGYFFVPFCKERLNVAQEYVRYLHEYAKKFLAYDYV